MKNKKNYLIWTMVGIVLGDWALYYYDVVAINTFYLILVLEGIILAYLTYRTNIGGLHDLFKKKEKKPEEKMTEAMAIKMFHAIYMGHPEVREDYPVYDLDMYYEDLDVRIISIGQEGFETFVYGIQGKGIFKRKYAYIIVDPFSKRVRVSNPRFDPYSWEEIEKIANRMAIKRERVPERRIKSSIDEGGIKTTEVIEKDLPYLPNKQQESQGETLER